MSPVAFRLRALRTAAKLTQAQLAEKAGVRQATVSDLESGKGRRLLVVMDKLARALGVEPGELLERVPARRRGKQ
jgi:transcriptional regulator with XRE-family HTH domain